MMAATRRRPQQHFHDRKHSLAWCAYLARRQCRSTSPCSTERLTGINTRLHRNSFRSMSHAEGPVHKTSTTSTPTRSRQELQGGRSCPGRRYDLGERKPSRPLSTIGIEATLVKPYFASGVDQNLLDNLVKDHDVIVTIEGGIIEGGWGQNIASYLELLPYAQLRHHGVRRPSTTASASLEILCESHIWILRACTADVKQVLGL